MNRLLARAETHHLKLSKPAAGHRGVLRRFPCRSGGRCHSAQHGTANAASRLHRLNNKLPLFLQRYTTPLMQAPVSHITVFLVLHELTAVIPLLGLATVFHYSDWLPESILDGDAVKHSLEKWTRYFRRKGWLPEDFQTSEVFERTAHIEKPDGTHVMDHRDTQSFAGARIVLEVAAAYAIVKALLPIRIFGCVWATPWIAARSLKVLRRFRKAKP